ncbi:unnamed protein product [Linum tenue]|uniref:Uncharacterized protein n=1 Tax=Linum tenue TaxID=586396 RepID=A0AAV0S0H5_9ROSI|nr:unnamed protein product [Linum tenue]
MGDAFNNYGNGGEEDRSQSDPFSLFAGWSSRPDPIHLFSDSSDLDKRFPFSNYNDVVSHQLLPQTTTELDGIFTQRQVVLNDDASPPILHHAANPDHSSSAALFDLLRSGAPISHRPNSNITIQSAAEEEDSGRPSTEDLLRIAGARFIQSSNTNNNPPLDDLSSAVGLSDEEARSVELAESLLTAAEKVGDGQYDKASILLTECELRSDPEGDPVQRLVHYFGRALREKTDRETGKQQKCCSLAGPEKVEEILMFPRRCFLEFYDKVPFGQVSEFAAIQAVVDSVCGSRRIHIVDFNIKNGEQWTIFMQALVSRDEVQSVDHLKISAVGIRSRDVMEETAQRLVDFARTMALSFSFNLVMLDDFADLKEDTLAVEPGETVAVLSEYLLTTLVAHSDKLDRVMKTIATLNPCVMVVTEVESNHNSPVLINRFVESLFYASAYFDCLEACMDRDSPHRRFVELTVFGEGSRIIVAAEGEERAFRSVKMEVWRAYFRRFGMEEADLSLSCLYQAELVTKKFTCWRHCTIGVDGKSLIVGWKGTPIHSVTAWKFNCE